MKKINTPVEKNTKKPIYKNSFIKKTEDIDSPQMKNFLNSTDIKKEESAIVKNGLTNIVENMSNQQNCSYMQGSQLSQLATLFQNERWYLISNQRQILSQAFVEHGIIKTLVGIPVDDAMRGGIDISSKQLDEDQIKDLKTCMTLNNDLNTTAQAHKWNRLYGGAAILIITGQDPSKPLDLKEIANGDYLEFKAIDMWELFYGQINIEDKNFLDDSFDLGLNVHNCENYNYYNKIVHKSRVIIMKGIEAPSFIRPRLRGWGVSVVEDLIRSLNQYLKANNLTFELMDELKIDVFKFEGYNDERGTPGGEQKIIQRTQLANKQKNYQNALVMDSKDDFAQKELSLTFLPETMNQIRIQLAADLRMPLTKLFGISSAGFSSGEDEIENYNAMVESTIRSVMHLNLLMVSRLRCLNLYGFVPDDLEVTFKPLRVMSSEQEENIKNQKYNRLIQAFDRQIMNQFQFIEACNREKLLCIQIDNAQNTLNFGENSEEKKNDRIVVESSSHDPNICMGVLSVGILMVLATFLVILLQ